MNDVYDPLIAALARDVAPVRAMRPRMGVFLVFGAVFLSAIAVVAAKGLQADFASGSVSELFLIGNGLLVFLGAAAGLSAISMATPRVGNRHDGARWSMYMAAVFPLSALALLFLSDKGWLTLLAPALGLHCASWSVVSALAIASVLILWLRRGAPVSPDTAGLHLGIASAALGSAIYGMTCSVDDIHHLGIWHALPVFAGAVIGRFGASKLLRW